MAQTDRNFNVGVIKKHHENILESKEGHRNYRSKNESLPLPIPTLEGQRFIMENKPWHIDRNILVLIEMNNHQP